MLILLLIHHHHLLLLLLFLLLPTPQTPDRHAKCSIVPVATNRGALSRQNCSVSAVGPEGKPFVVFGRNNWDEGTRRCDLRAAVLVASWYPSPSQEPYGSSGIGLAGVQVRVTGVDNFFADGSRLGFVTHTVMSEDPNYETLQDDDPLVRLMTCTVLRCCDCCTCSALSKLRG